MSPEASWEILIWSQVMDTSWSGVDDQIFCRKQVFALLVVPKDLMNRPPNGFPFLPGWKVESSPPLQLFNNGEAVDSYVGESVWWVIAEFPNDLCVVKLKGE